MVTVLLLAVVVTAGVLRQRYHQWPWQALPERVSVCGRMYLGPGSPATMSEVASHGNSVIAHVISFRGVREVWGSRSGVAGDRCGTGIYIRTGSTTFRAYALSGGP